MLIEKYKYPKVGYLIVQFCIKRRKNVKSLTLFALTLFALEAGPTSLHKGFIIFMRVPPWLFSCRISRLPTTPIVTHLRWHTFKVLSLFCEKSIGGGLKLVRD